MVREPGQQITLEIGKGHAAEHPSSVSHRNKMASHPKKCSHEIAVPATKHWMNIVGETNGHQSENRLVLFHDNAVTGSNVGAFAQNQPHCEKLVAYLSIDHLPIDDRDSSRHDK